MEVDIIPRHEEDPSFAARQCPWSLPHHKKSPSATDEGIKGVVVLRNGHLNSKQRGRAKLLVRLIAFLCVLSFGLLFTTFTELLLGSFDHSYSRTAAYIGMCSFFERGLSFGVGPFWGMVSDTRGRKPLMITSIVIPILALTAVLIKPLPQVVLLRSIVSGLFNVVEPVINAITTDLAREGSEADLALQYGRLGVAVGLALVIGPAVGAVMSDYSVRMPIYAALSCLTLSLMACLAMPESLDPKYRGNTILWSDIDPFQRLRAACRYRAFTRMALPFALTHMAECVYEYAVLYFKERYGWSYKYMGMYIAAIGITIAITQANLRHVVPRYVSEKSCVTVGMGAQAVAQTMMGLIGNGWYLYTTVPVQMVASLKLPGLMGIMTANVPALEQGVLQGSMSSLKVFSTTIGAPIFGAMFTFGSSRHARRPSPTTAAYLGLPFLVSALLNVVAMYVAVYIFWTHAQDGGGLSLNEASVEGGGLVSELGVQGTPCMVESSRSASSCESGYYVDRDREEKGDEVLGDGGNGVPGHEAAAEAFGDTYCQGQTSAVVHTPHRNTPCHPQHPDSIETGSSHGGTCTHYRSARRQHGDGHHAEAASPHHNGVYTTAPGVAHPPPSAALDMATQGTMMQLVGGASLST